VKHWERCQVELLVLQNQIIRKVSALNVTAFLTKGEDEKANGLYGRAYDKTGRRSSELFIPVADDGSSLDSHDRTIDRQNGKHVTDARQIDHIADVMLQRERDRGTTLDPQAARALAEAESGGAECGECGLTDGGRRRLGLCDACYQRDLARRKRA
jgi:hypothetical protein